MKDEQEQGKVAPVPYLEEFAKKYEIHRLHVDFFERLIFLVIAGLGLITALAWDEFFKDVFVRFFGSIEGASQRLLYALLLTLLTVIVTLFLRKGFKRRK